MADDQFMEHGDHEIRAAWNTLKLHYADLLRNLNSVWGSIKSVWNSCYVVYLYVRLTILYMSITFDAAAELIWQILKHFDRQYLSSFVAKFLKGYISHGFSVHLAYFITLVAFNGDEGAFKYISLCDLLMLQAHTVVGMLKTAAIKSLSQSVVVNRQDSCYIYDASYLAHIMLTSCYIQFECRFDMVASLLIILRFIKDIPETLIWIFKKEKFDEVRSFHVKVAVLLYQSIIAKIVIVCMYWRFGTEFKDPFGTAAIGRAFLRHICRDYILCYCLKRYRMMIPLFRLSSKTAGVSREPSEMEHTLITQSPDDCGFCLDPLKSSPVRKLLSCGHYVHTHCLHALLLSPSSTLQRCLVCTAPFGPAPGASGATAQLSTAIVVFQQPAGAGAEVGAGAETSGDQPPAEELTRSSPTGGVVSLFGDASGSDGSRADPMPTPTPMDRPHVHQAIFADRPFLERWPARASSATRSPFMAGLEVMANLGDFVDLAGLPNQNDLSALAAPAAVSDLGDLVDQSEQPLVGGLGDVADESELQLSEPASIGSAPAMSPHQDVPQQIHGAESILATRASILGPEPQSDLTSDGTRANTTGEPVFTQEIKTPLLPQQEMNTAMILAAAVPKKQPAYISNEDAMVRPIDRNKRATSGDGISQRGGGRQSWPCIKDSATTPPQLQTVSMPLACMTDVSDAVDRSKAEAVGVSMRSGAIPSHVTALCLASVDSSSESSPEESSLSSPLPAGPSCTSTLIAEVETEAETETTKKSILPIAPPLPEASTTHDCAEGEREGEGDGDEEGCDSEEESEDCSSCREYSWKWVDDQIE